MIEPLNATRCEATDWDDCAAVGRRDGAGWYCSGVLVHPRLILTTAHSGPLGHSSIPRAVITGTSDLSNTTKAEIIDGQFIAHEAFTGKGAYDLATMLLSRDCTSLPAPLATTAEIAAAGDVVLAGYGADREARLSLRLRRAARVPLSYFGALPATLPPALASIRFNPELEFLAGAEDCGPSFGDSGGPVYLMVEGRRKLAGIISRPAARQKPYCKGLTILTRIDVFASWLEARIRQADSTACSPKAGSATCPAA